MKFTTFAGSIALVIGASAFAQNATFDVLDQAFYCMDVTPDGQRFVMIEEDRGRMGTELMVVENWFEELKRLAPVGE